MSIGYFIAVVAGGAGIGTLLVLLGRYRVGYSVLVALVVFSGWVLGKIVWERTGAVGDGVGGFGKLVAVVEQSPAGAVFASVGVVALIWALFLVFGNRGCQGCDGERRGG